MSWVLIRRRLGEGRRSKCIQVSLLVGEGDRELVADFGG